MQLKMMTFKALSSLKAIVYIVLLSFAPLLSADTTVDKSEKNDKIVSDDASVQNVSNTSKSGGKAESTAWVLHAEQWELTRSGESVLSLPVLNQVMNAWLLDTEKKIEIQYPGGEEGEFWVQQLSDWLVSLGIPSGRMVIVPGSGADDMIKFDLIK
ncbi:MAG: hypothetical protein ACC650_01565 [Gammaproteobacteria bacterium]